MNQRLVLLNYHTSVSVIKSENKKHDTNVFTLVREGYLPFIVIYKMSWFT